MPKGEKNHKLPGATALGETDYLHLSGVIEV